MNSKWSILCRLSLTHKVKPGLLLVAWSCVPLAFALLLLIASTVPAVAQPGITIGVAVDGGGLISSSEQARDLGRFLEEQLSLPVRVRSFTSEDQLSLWLTRFREVDVAWISERALAKIPAGQLYPLAKSHDSPPSPSGQMVARQGLSPSVYQHVTTILLTMHESPSGQVLLSQLGTSRLVSPEQQHVSAKVFVATPGAHGLSSQAAAIGSAGPPAVPEVTAPVEETVAAVSSPEKSQKTVPVLQEDSSQKRIEPQTAELENVSQGDTDKIQPRSVGIEGDQSTPFTATSPDIDREEQVTLVADYLEYNSEQDSYEAKGDVTLRQADVELKSETLLWQSLTQDVAAQGSVSLRDAGTEISGERMQYNVATGQGQIRDGRLFVEEGNFHLAGAQIEKHNQTEYFVESGSFTTCDGEIPDWKFSASEVDVTLGGYARAKNVWFHIKDVPVLYTPYLSFPVMTERESGFLLPTIGHSSTKGTRASVAWYQVIDRHMDATLYLDYFSDIGLGKGIEYRYALAEQNNGKAFYQHVTGISDTPDLLLPEMDPSWQSARWFETHG